MLEPGPVQTVLLTGTVGAGKTSVAEEISTLLYEIEVPHACIDMDWLCQLYPAPQNDPHNQALMFANLGAVWTNFRRRRPKYLILARALEAREELRCYQEALPEAMITVVRVVASAATIERRLRQREIGSFFQTLWTRSRELTSIQEDVALEDFIVSNDGGTLREVALEVMGCLQWPRP